jgi:hypothetical protein
VSISKAEVLWPLTNGREVITSMAKKKAPKKSLKDKFNAAYEKMEFARMKERSSKAGKGGGEYCGKGGCNCGK